MPRGWTTESRRVKVMTPAGVDWKDITFYRNAIGMELVAVPSGVFTMGTDGPSVDTQPRHEVRIRNAFYMGAYEVTAGQYMTYLEETKCEEGVDFDWTDCPITKERRAYCLSRESTSRNEPMVALSLRATQLFCRWLTKKEGCTYRLPTEAEWEYAYRAGSQTHFYSGNADSSVDWIAWQDRKLHKVGQKLPNAFGLYDMAGNAGEWCQSLYKRYPYDERDGREDLTADGPRVVRHGGTIPGNLSGADRSSAYPGTTSRPIGFRVVVVQDANE
ncbi:MAG: formylglycine-generating enzyme family protein [Planctomycetes bacterium]|nr:formylglycine-generating enzyme family protein [Planctomycetota bacterium]